MKKFFKIFGIVVGGLFVLMIIGAMIASIGMGEIKKLKIVNVDMTQKADGVYPGSYHKGRWTYDVEVTVAGHKITAIKETNPSMRPNKKLTDKIVEKIIEKQAVNIDAVSRASVNTKALCKAVEIALTR